MDYVDRLAGLASGRAAQPATKLLSFTPLTPRVQQHLAQVRWGVWRSGDDTAVRPAFLPGASAALSSLC